MPSTFKQPIYISGDNWDVAYPVGPPIFSAPIAGVSFPYVAKQEFQILKRSFAYLPLDQGINYQTANPDYWSEWEAYFTAIGFDSDLFALVEESETADVGGGVVRWTRTFAVAPSQHVQPTTITYDFPQFYPGYTRFALDPGTGIGGMSAAGRPTARETVNGFSVFDYAYIEDEEDVDTLLPQVPAQLYGFKNASTGVPYPYSAAYSPPSIWYSGKDYNGDPNPGGVPASQNSQAAILDVSSNPTREEYEAWIAKTFQNPSVTGLTIPPPAYLNYALVAQPSSTERWMGNIYVRKTIFVFPL